MSLTIAYPTRKPKSEKFKQHLKKSSGVKDVELLEYVNPNGDPLTEIYNKALDDASNDVVTLMHDDLFFNEENKNGWGKKLLKHFKGSDYGILGVAGTTHLPASGKWWEDTTKMVGIVKHSNVDEEGNKRTWESKYSNNFGNRIIETAVLDGLFIAVHKERIEERFDENIRGMHFYDIDFTLNNHLKGVKVGVVFDIKLTHESIGETDEKWEENRKQFVDKYAMHPETNEPLLPYNIDAELIYDEKDVHIPKKKQPKLLIVTPTGGSDTVGEYLRSIKEKTSYENYKVVVANTTDDENKKEELAEIVDHDERFNFVDEEYINFATINNKLVTDWADEDTELILFANDDIKLINDAISRMVQTYLKNKKDVGTIGARLHFGDNSVQHSGIMLMLGRDGKLHISHYGLNSYYNYRDDVQKDVFGNTGAFMMITKDTFYQVGGFEDEYNECFEDVHFNIDCINMGKTNIFDGTAVCYHYESQTRNKDGDKLERESEDYKKAIGNVVNNPKTYGYFINIRRQDFEALVKQTMEKQKQRENG